MKILLAFCEGPHDVAFLSRVLCANDYTDISKKLALKDYPHQIRDFFVEQRKMMGFKAENDDSVNVGELTERILLPSVLVNRKLATNSKGKLTQKPIFEPTETQEEDKFIFLFLCGGSQILSLPKIIIDKFAIFAKKSQDENGFNDLNINPLYFSIAFIPDADDKGIQTVEIEFREKYSEFIEYPFIKSFEVYVLAGENEKGCLEDILLPLIKKCSDNKEVILTNTNTFIEKNKPENVWTKADKATISIIGQFEKGLTGSSNAVIIAQTQKYLNDEVIKNDPKCREIFIFFNDLIATL